ncbi:hypothetical protein BKA69DRAFT_1121332 [Paraphysoderma sedebokerense]|nr:hypothetical protein BKA69DRAFT_1121332 [Paraphysoderma sedebokerense]
MTTATPEEIPAAQTPAPVKGKQLFIGNLPWIVRWQELKDLMKQSGTVIRANVMTDHSGRSRGFGTVLFASAEDADKAIESYNNYEWHGRQIEVREDRAFAPAGENGEAAKGNRALWIGNLPFSVTWQDLKDLLRSTGGNPLRADIAMDFRTGRSRGHGTALFATAEEAEKAIETLNGTEFQGRKIEVRADNGFVEGAPYQPFERDMMMKRRNFGYNNRRFNGPAVSGNFAGRQLYVGNLPFTVAWQDLKDLFRNAGNVVRADIATFDGRSKGYGTVVFATREDALNAIQMYNGYDFYGRQLVVREDKFASGENADNVAEDEA